MLKNSPIRYVEEKDLGFHEHFLDPYLELVISLFYISFTPKVRETSTLSCNT